MKAYLRSARIAPKKANIIAKMVRGMPVGEAMDALAHTNKKGARMVQELLKSAMANAEHNDKQNTSVLVIKSIVVNQSLGYRRGVPMARGRMRPMTKFLSHISLTLGVAGDSAAAAKHTSKKTSQTASNTVQKPGTRAKKSETSVSSASQATAGGSDSDVSSVSSS